MRDENENYLSGEVACLSPLRDSDCDILYSWINDKELVLSNAPYRSVSYTDHLKWFESIRNRPDVVIHGIRLVQDDTMIGSCQLHSIDQTHRSAELQIRIGEKNFQGQGIGAEACRLLLEHAFVSLNLNRVYLHVFETNKQAIALYKKCGFVVEGTLRRAAYIDGHWLDVLVMGILQEEFVAA